LDLEIDPKAVQTNRRGYHWNTAGAPWTTLAVYFQSWALATGALLYQGAQALRQVSYAMQHQCKCQDQNQLQIAAWLDEMWLNDSYYNK